MGRYQKISNKNSSLEISRKSKEFKNKLKINKRINLGFKIALYLFLILYALVSLYPLIWALLASLIDPNFIKSLGMNPVPKGASLSFGNYRSLFTNPLTREFAGAWIINSMIYSIMNATINCFFNFLAGYALARISFKGKKFIIWYIIVAMMVPVQATQIPQLFILIKLGIIDPYQSNFLWLLGVLSTGMTSGVLIFMVRQFYINKSSSIEEAGLIDGLSRFKVFWKVSLRSMMPLLATQWAMIFIGSWNNFIMFTLWASGDPSRMTLTAAFQTLADNKYGNAGAGRMLAAANLAIIPVLVVYLGSLHFQRKVMVDGEK